MVGILLFAAPNPRPFGAPPSKEGGDAKEIKYFAEYWVTLLTNRIK